ncbi:hypothetical protein SAMN05428946_0383 [Edaphobacillus lindanitolerans]|uniref:Uncharacterized protein n=1 Tax=Edaphobacillus lindanitolerans TaxID=550447 RepID=A0A1U7PJQ2_9BACI|nr:hypothetical protein SAMN05428946_0383 [Edaphobacillus lindanitolerans]
MLCGESLGNSLKHITYNKLPRIQSQQLF